MNIYILIHMITVIVGAGASMGTFHSSGMVSTEVRQIGSAKIWLQTEDAIDVLLRNFRRTSGGALSYPMEVYIYIYIYISSIITTLI